MTLRPLLPALSAAIVSIISATPSGAQSPSKPAPEAVRVSAPPAADRFEVASIKPVQDLSRGVIGGEFRVNGYTATSMTVKSYIQVAYNIPYWDWIVGPEWLDAGMPAYSVTANASGPMPVRALRIMLQNLLKDRFGLKCHVEVSEQPVFALVTMKSGHKLRQVQYEEADADLCVRPAPQGLEATHCSMAAFSSFLSSFVNLGRPVIDKTGISGRFDFQLRYASRGMAPLREVPVDNPLPSIFEAVQTLGLKLEARKAPVERLVIDEIKQVPTED